jgi:hypothetical protein
MRNRMYDVRRDEDDGTVLRFAKPLQTAAGPPDGDPPRNQALTDKV